MFHYIHICIFLNKLISLTSPCVWSETKQSEKIWQVCWLWHPKVHKCVQNKRTLSWMLPILCKISQCLMRFQAKGIWNVSSETRLFRRLWCWLIVIWSFRLSKQGRIGELEWGFLSWPGFVCQTWFGPESYRIPLPQTSETMVWSCRLEVEMFFALLTSLSFGCSIYLPPPTPIPLCGLTIGLRLRLMLQPTEESMSRHVYSIAFLLHEQLYSNGRLAQLTL